MVDKLYKEVKSMVTLSVSMIEKSMRYQRKRYEEPLEEIEEKKGKQQTKDGVNIKEVIA